MAGAAGVGWVPVASRRFARDICDVLSFGGWQN
jgi:hypothetical protein